MRTIILFATTILSFNYSIYAQNNTDSKLPMGALDFAHSLQKCADRQLLKSNDGIPVDLLTFSIANPNGFMEEQWKMNMHYKDGKLVSYLRSTTANKTVSERTTFKYNDRDQLINISIYYVLNGGGKGQLKTDLSYNQNGICTKIQDWQNNFLLRGDSVQIITNDKKVTAYLTWRYSDGEWILSSKVSNINYNKTGFIRSYTAQSYNAKGAEVKNEFITDLVFFNESPQEVMKRVCPGLNPDNELQSGDIKILNKVLNGSEVIAEQFLKSPVAYRKVTLDLATNKYSLSEIKSFFKTPDNQLYVFTENIIAKDKSLPVIVEKIQLDDQNRPVSVHQTFQRGEYINEETVTYNAKNQLTGHIHELTSFSEVHTFNIRAEENFTVKVEGNKLKSITEEKTVEDNGEKVRTVSEFTFRYKVKVEDQKTVIHPDNFYPNPTLGPVEVDLGGEEVKDNSLFVQDLGGNRINPAFINISSGKIQLDLSNLTAGVYIVRYDTDKQSHFSKIVKN